MRELPSLTACCWTTLSLDRAAIEAVQERAVASHPGAAVVVTCQRTEAYSTDGGCVCDAPSRFEGLAALSHLAEVAAGLESVVLGEVQILGQVRNGFEGASGPLRQAVTLALAAARELRREVSFNSHAGALLDRALKLAGRPAMGTLLVLGAGQMGRLVAERGLYLGFDDVVVASRSRPGWWTGRWTGLGKVGRMPGVDVICGCLGSGASAIEAAALPAAALIVDLGTPANFTAGQGAEVVSLATMMADEQRRPHALKRRADLARDLHGKINRRLGSTMANHESPVGDLRREVERVRVAQVGRIRRLHPDIAPEDVDAITRSLVNQLFHGASERLKAADPRFSRRVAELFAT